MPDSTGRKRFGLVRSTGPRTRIITTLAAITLALLAGLLALGPAGRSLVLLSYDLPFVVHRAVPSNEIAVVYLDQRDGDALDRKPQAALVDALGKAGARALVYDVIFDREDPHTDPAFAAAMRRFRGVDEAGNPIPGAPPRPIFLACGRRAFQLTGAIGEELIPPNDLLLDAAGDFGLVAYDEDDYVARKLITGSLDEPSLTWNAATALGAPLSEESRHVPRWLNYSAPPSTPEGTPAFQTIPASSAVLDDLNPELFRDKIVVIGGEPGIVGTALGKDLFSTPFHQLRTGRKLPYISGPELQATMLENLLQGNWLVRSDRQWDLPLVGLAALLLGTLFSLLRPGPGIVAAIVGIVLMAAAGFWTVQSHGTWIPWTIPAFVQLPLAVLCGTGSQFYLELYRRRRLDEAFGTVVSPEVLKQLEADDYELKLGGEKKPAALMFTDLQDFTNMCEGIGDPVVILNHLNNYFEAATEQVFDQNGSVIQFVGDAIYAAWGAPVDVDDPSILATRAAWALSQKARFQIKSKRSGKTYTLPTRIGLHFGDVVAGNAGSTKHVVYSLMGDATNLAARLEGLNKLFGTDILLSESVHAQLDDEFHTRRVGRFCVKGKAAPTTIYELVGPATEGPAPTWIDEYHTALETLEANKVEEAMTLFRALNRQLDPSADGSSGDGPASFFLKHLNTVKTITDGIVHLNVK